MMRIPLQNVLAQICLLFVVISSLQACGATDGPKPILYGKDQCVYCKMTISDARFGTQLVTKKGRIYNFDDLSCMIAFAQDGPIAKDDIAQFYIPDYTQEKKLYKAQEMLYLKSEGLKSPMRGDIAAFKNASDLHRIKKEFGGVELSWSEIWK